MKDEIRALLVRDAAVRVIGILALLEADDKSLELGSVLVLLQRVVQGFVPDHVCEAAFGGRVQRLLQHALDVGRPALVEPEV